MRILCVWMPDYISTSYEMTHYLPALKSLGHDAKFLPLNEYTNERILDIVKMWRPHLAIFKLYRDKMRIEIAAHISNRTNTTTAVIRGDDEKYFDINKPWDSVNVAPHFNYVLTTYKKAVPAYKTLRIKNVIYSPYGCNHEYCKREKLKKDVDVSFLGTRKWNRVDLLNYLAYHGVNLLVYGMGWPDNKGEDRILAPEDYVWMMNKTKVNINCQIDIVKDGNADAVKGKKTMQVKGRDFEVPMCGGFLLTNYNDDLKEFYKFGKEIETYKDHKECLSKIRYYLKHDDKRERIAKAGYKRARKDHTYVKRFRKVLSKIELKKGIYEKRKS